MSKPSLTSSCEGASFAPSIPSHLPPLPPLPCRREVTRPLKHQQAFCRSPEATDLFCTRICTSGCLKRELPCSQFLLFPSIPIFLPSTCTQPLSETCGAKLAPGNPPSAVSAGHAPMAVCMKENWPGKYSLSLEKL